MKKGIIICVCIIVSLLTSVINPNTELFLTDSKIIIEILLTLLGLSFTSFSFISTSIDKIVKKVHKKGQENIQFEDNLKKLLDNIEEDIFLIFWLALAIIITNLIKYLDIPLIINPHNINFGLITIFSIKDLIINFCISLAFCLSTFSFYDLIKATFKLLRSKY